MTKPAAIFSLIFTAVEHTLFFMEGFLHRLLLRGYTMESAVEGAGSDIRLRMFALQTFLQLIYLLFLWRIKNKVKRAISTVLCLYLCSDLIFIYILLRVGLPSFQSKVLGLAFRSDNLTYDLGIFTSIVATTLIFMIPLVERRFWPRPS